MLAARASGLPDHGSLLTQSKRQHIDHITV